MVPVSQAGSIAVWPTSLCLGAVCAKVHGLLGASKGCETVCIATCAPRNQPRLRYTTVCVGPSVVVFRAPEVWCVLGAVVKLSSGRCGLTFRVAQESRLVGLAVRGSNTRLISSVLSASFVVPTRRLVVPKGLGVSELSGCVITRSSVAITMAAAVVHIGAVTFSVLELRFHRHLVALRACPVPGRSQRSLVECLTCPEGSIPMAGSMTTLGGEAKSCKRGEELQQLSSVVLGCLPEPEGALERRLIARKTTNSNAVIGRNFSYSKKPV